MRRRVLFSGHGRQPVIALAFSAMHGATPHYRYRHCEERRYALQLATKAAPSE
jgi:hypothetical protein